jgi:subtilisin family serine protease
VFAPGVGIISTYDTASNSYASLSGTSMATPCVAGLSAMILMANPSMTAQQAETFLYSTCDNIGSSVTFGNGRVNLNAALRAVYNNTTFSPSAISVTLGTLAGGGTASLPSQDNQFLVGATASTTTRASTFQAQLDTFTTISNIGTLKLTFAGLASSADVLQTVELFDFINNAWVQVDQRPAAQSNTALTLQPSTPNRFKNTDGMISARFTFQRTTGRSTVQVSVDQVAFLTAP